MRNLLDKILSFLPYLILGILGGSVLIFLFKKDLTYDQYLSLIDILIWPTIISLALLFFRKVFTYLFFSIEEFNFFGTRGRLKNVEEIIEERVQKKIKEEKDEEKRQLELDRIALELNNANKSKDGAEKRAEENLALANKVFKSYEKIFDKHDQVSRELEVLKKEKEEREKRIQLIRERFQERRSRRLHGEENKEELS